MSNEQLIELPDTKQTVDLASERLGGKALACSDDFFAGMDNLIKAGRGVFIEDKYTSRGKWMDGWESRRSFGRENGRDFDWCILRLAIPGTIEAIDVDTNHFRGNAPEKISLEACYSTKDNVDINTLQWETIVPETAVSPHSQNIIKINPSLLPDRKNELASNESPGYWSHIRLNIFPDGGVARLRVYGKPFVNWQQFLPGELIDLASIKHGGQAIQCSDMFFSNMNNLLFPGRGINMADGWETRRRRDQFNDWVIIKLGCQGSIRKVLLDTCHFKGNFPDSFSLEAATVPDRENTSNTTLPTSTTWHTVIARTRLSAHHEHVFTDDILSTSDQTFTHVRLNIFPDGGVSRLRIFGYRQESQL